MFVCSSELQELATEATEDDGHLARIPLKNKAREMEAHRFLHLKFDDMIENHSAALEVVLYSFNHGAFRGSLSHRFHIIQTFVNFIVLEKFN